jgi:hypothetical protein
VLGTTAMSGLPPNRTPDAIATAIENYVSDDGKPAAIIDYYQFVMADYFGTMGIPIVAGRGFERTDNACSGRGRTRSASVCGHWLDLSALAMMSGIG